MDLSKLIGEHVILSFADGYVTAGRLASVSGDKVEVEHTHGRHYGYTAEYTLIGDGDTPRLVSVTRIPAQTEKLF